MPTINQTEKVIIDSQIQNENEDINTKKEIDISKIKNFISKKTLRGRKAKNPLPKLQRCEICLEFNEYSTDSLIQCSICKCNFHPSCYHIPLNLNDNNIKEFKCERCKNAFEKNIPIENLKCFICSLSNGVLYYNEKNDNYYHSLCLKFIPELYEDYNEDDISRDKIRKWRYKNSCKYCNQKLSKEKAVMKCNNPKCKCYFHIPCAIEKGMIFSINFLKKFYSIENHCKNIAIPFYCSSHNKKLASEYRKNVIYNENYDPENINCDCYCSRSFHRNKIRKMSNNSFSNENNVNDNTTHSSNNTNNIIDNSDGVYSLNSSPFNFIDNDYEKFEYNKILDLNFNELLIDDYEEKDEYIINFDNVSPKDKIPLSLYYNNEGILD